MNFIVALIIATVTWFCGAPLWAAVMFFPLLLVAMVATRVLIMIHKQMTWVIGAFKITESYKIAFNTLEEVNAALRGVKDSEPAKNDAH